MSLIKRKKICSQIKSQNKQIESPKMIFLDISDLQLLQHNISTTRFNKQQSQNPQTSHNRSCHTLLLVVDAPEL